MAQRWSYTREYSGKWNFYRLRKEKLFAWGIQGGRIATLTAAGVIAPAADEEALWFLMKLDQSRHGDILNELTNDAMRGTP